VFGEEEEFKRDRERERDQTDIQKSCLFLSPQEELFGCSGITVQSGRGRLMRVTLHINIFKRRRRRRRESCVATTTLHWIVEEDEAKKRE
jgi:hypothetical protein